MMIMMMTAPSKLRRRLFVVAVVVFTAAVLAVLVLPSSPSSHDALPVSLSLLSDGVVVDSSSIDAYYGGGTVGLRRHDGSNDSPNFDDGVSPGTTTTAATGLSPASADGTNSVVVDKENDDMIVGGTGEGTGRDYGGAGAHPRFQVYAFAPDFMRLSDNYRRYDYTRIKTLCLFGIEVLHWQTDFNQTQKEYVMEVVETVHAYNVDVDIATNYPVDKLHDEAYRFSYVNALLKIMQLFQFDGINIDTEDPIDADDVRTRDALTSLVAEIRHRLDKSFKKHHKRKYLSFDVAWSPNGIDNRNYDYAAIANVVDVMFVMVSPAEAESRLL